MMSWCAFFYFLFFFFKQKTAYEMRISDWSSDVCSSDLSFVCRIVQRPLLLEDTLADPHMAFQSPFCKLSPTFRAGFSGAQRPFVEIGRASCRERVCQYV